MIIGPNSTTTASKEIFLRIFFLLDEQQSMITSPSCLMKNKMSEWPEPGGFVFLDHGEVHYSQANCHQVDALQLSCARIVCVVYYCCAVQLLPKSI